MPAKKKSTKALKSGVQRTFNTTSVAKKPAPVEEEQVEEKDDAAAIVAATPDAGPETPEQAVEDAELYQLQLLADKVKGAAQKEISRTIKAYEYERRLTKTLPQFEWTNTRALEAVLQASLAAEKQPVIYSGTNDTEEKAMVKAAIVYGILEHLGFKKQRILETLLKTRNLDLEEALDWLVLHCPTHELRFQSNTTALSSADVVGMCEVEGGTSEQQSKPATSSSSKYKLTNTEIDQVRENPTTAYVSAKIDAQLLKSHKRRHLTNGYSSDFLHNQSKRQQALMDKAVGEYLFDRRDADLAFRNWRNEHEAKDGAGKEEDVDACMDRIVAASGTNKPTVLERSTEAATASNEVSAQVEKLAFPGSPGSRLKDLDIDGGTPPSEIKTNGAAAEPVTAETENDEAENMFGNLLDAPPTEVTTSTGSVITVRDFSIPKGFSGKTPRALLEELCRRKDKFSRVSFSQRGEANAAYAMVTVKWENGPMQAFTMTDDACQNHAQAFNYVATLALFALDTAAVHRQLPPVFKTLWDELASKKQAIEDEALRQHTVELQTVIEARKKASQPVVKMTKSASDEQIVGAPKFNRVVQQDDASGVQLQQDFSQRQSRPAYQEMLSQRESLPIAAFRDTIMHAINTSQVVIVSAETGAGKSTQVPAFILEQELSKGEHVKVYCTQPRRISAISLANRVSRELGDPAGACGSRSSLVGYSIRLESKVSATTRLVYATTGIVLRMLDGDDTLQGITHLIIDEIHERSIDTDFLMIIVSDILKKRTDLRIILMSATVDAERMSQYMNDCPVVKVPGRTFPVTSYFLEDAIELTNYRLTEGCDSQYVMPFRRSKMKSALNDEDLRSSDQEDALAGTVTLGAGYSKATKSTLDILDQSQINYDLLIALLEQICCYNHQFTAQFFGAVLIFLPSLESIKRLNDTLEAHPVFGSASFQLHPLHSTISSENQIKVFQIPPKGTRKIVIATNIAETGITIPDTTCVIDSGKHREMRFDEKRQISRLVETYIAQSNAMQRRGRAGRVQEGLCFHLFTKSRFEEQMAKHPLPEMLRLSLQDLSLRIKTMPLFTGTVESVLLRAMDPPSSINIQRAVASLQEVRALTANEDITPLGLLLAKLPMDVHLGKLLILACLFKCVEPALTIAAALSSKSPFVAPFGRELEADAAKRGFKVDNSDFLSLHKAYTSWRRACLDGTHFTFCRKHFISHNNMTQIEELRQSFYDLLVDCKLAHGPRQTVQSKTRIRFFDTPESLNENQKDNRLVMAVVTAAMYPKLLVIDPAGQYRTLINNAPAAIHPSSINFMPGRRPDFKGAKFLTFFNIMSTKKLYAWETASCDTLAVMLLCGDVDSKLATESITLDRKVRMAISAKGGLAIKSLRAHFDAIFDQRINQPTGTLAEDQQIWWDSICDSLRSEEVANEAEQEAVPKMTIRF